VLDTAAATYLGKMIREHPRVIADAQDFAIPPFEHMWIEIPFGAYYEAITGRVGDANADKAVGYLFHGPTVTVAAQSRLGASWMPVEYTLHHPNTIEEQLDLANKMSISRAGLDLWYWGESANDFVHPKEEGGWEREPIRALRANHGARLVPLANRFKHMEYPFAQITSGSNGDLRNIVSTLLFLNRTRDIQYERELPLKQGLVNRKPRPWMPHRVISLKLDPMPRLMTLAAGQGIKRRLHDVRGHFCHDKQARAGCMHGEQTLGDWGDFWVEYDVLQWRCTHCGGKRWWRHEHQRGSQHVGVIKEQTYAVTK